MTRLFCERQDRLNAGKRLFDFFWTNVRILSKVWAIIGWTAIILAPSFVEGFEFLSLKEEAKFVHRNFVLLESSLQYSARLYGSGYQRLRVPQLGEFRSEGFSKLHASEAPGVDVGKTKSEIEGNPCPNKSTDKSEYRLFHPDPLIDGIIGGFAGLALGSIIVVCLCKYVWFA